MSIAQILYEVTDLPLARRQHLVTAFENDTLTEAEKDEVADYIRTMIDRKQELLEAVRDARAQLAA